MTDRRLVPTRLLVMPLVLLAVLVLVLLVVTGLTVVLLAGRSHRCATKGQAEHHSEDHDQALDHFVSFI